MEHPRARAPIPTPPDSRSGLLALCSRVKAPEARRRLVRMALGAVEPVRFLDGENEFERIAALVEALPDEELLPPGMGHDDPPTIGGPLLRGESAWPTTETE